VINIKSSSLERRIKSIIPNWIKYFLLGLLVNDISGFLIKKSGVSFNLYGGLFDYSLVSANEAARIFFGFWEAAEIRFSKRFARSSTIVELGSSVGVTLGVLANNRMNTRFICIEASPINYSKLTKIQAKLPDNNNEYFLINKAVAYNVDTVHFCHESTTGAKIVSGANTSFPSTEVSAISLSTIIDHFKIDHPFTLISDIEGAEASIFFDDGNALLNCEMIIAEIENTTLYSFDEQMSRLIGLGYHVKERYGNVVVFARTV